MEKQIYDYCFEYGYETIDTDWLDIADRMLLPMNEVPDNFYDVFGVDAEWNESAEYAGMAQALKEITGKNHIVYCDGYRVVGVVGKKADAKHYTQYVEEQASERAAQVFTGMFASIMR